MKICCIIFLLINNNQGQLYYLIFVLINTINMEESLNNQMTYGQDSCIYVIKKITINVQRQGIQLLETKQVVKVIIGAYLNFRSDRVIQALAPLLEIIAKNIKIMKETSEKYLKKDLFLTLNIIQVLILNISDHTKTKQKYENALQLCPTHPLLLFCFASFLQKTNQFQAIKYLSKINIETAINVKYKESFYQVAVYLVKHVNEDFNLTATSYDYLLKSQFATKKYQLIANFIKAVINYGGSQQFMNYIILIAILLLLNRIEEAFDWTHILNIKYPKLNLANHLFSIILSRINRFKENIPYIKQVIAANPNNELFYQNIIFSLIEIKEFGEAKLYVNKLIKINKRNHIAYQKMGLILSIEGKYKDAIQWYKISLSINSQDAETYRYLGDTFQKLMNFQDARKSYILSVKIKPNYLAYICLAIISRLKYTIDAVIFFEKSIRLDLTKFQPYINLYEIGKQNKQLRHFINKIMKKIEQDYPSDDHIKFNFSFYYILSKESNRQFCELICKFLSKNKDKNEKDQQSNKKIVHSLLQQCQSFSFQFRHRYNFISMVIGVLSRLNNNKKQAHQCCANLFNKYRTNQNQRKQQIFTQIYKKVLINKTKELSHVFLEFMAIEILEQSIQEGLQCYYKAFNYCEDKYVDFHELLKLKLNQQFERIDVLLQIIGDVYKVSLEGINIQADLKKIIKLQDFRAKMYQMKNMLKDILNIESSNMFEKYFGVFFPCSNQDNILEKTLIGINWNKNFSDYCTSLCLQIKQQERNIIQTIQRYVKEHEREQILKMAYILLYNYFVDQFWINQIIKLVFNGFTPFLRFTRTFQKQQFALILTKFKNLPYHSLQQLKKDLQNLIRQNAGTNQQPQQQQEEQSQKPSSIIFEEHEQFDPLGFRMGRAQSEASQVDPFEKQSEQQIDNHPESLTNKRKRKLSESAVAYINNNEYQAFIQKIKQQKKQKVFKLIRVPFKDIQSGQSQEQQDSDFDFASDSDSDSGPQYQPSQVQPALFYNTNSATSQIPSSYLSQNKMKKFQLQYKLSDIKFKYKRLYQNFIKMLFFNTFAIIKYLSRNHKNQHIARHYLDKNCSDPIDHFNIQIEKGDQIKYPGRWDGLEDKIMKWIIFMGKEHVLQWIVDIAKGIAELQSLGLYHADLYFRNTIKVSHAVGSRFKIIDFDKAFKVKQTTKVDGAYQYTKKLIQYWLQFKFDGDPSPPHEAQSQFSPYLNFKYKLIHKTVIIKIWIISYFTIGLFKNNEFRAQIKNQPSNNLRQNIMRLILQNTYLKVLSPPQQLSYSVSKAENSLAKDCLSASKYYKAICSIVIRSNIASSF